MVAAASCLYGRNATRGATRGTPALPDLDAVSTLACGWQRMGSSSTARTWEGSAHTTGPLNKRGSVVSGDVLFQDPLAPGSASAAVRTFPPLRAAMSWLARGRDLLEEPWYSLDG